MMSSAHSLGKKLKQTPSWLIWIFVIVSFIGFLDASYLTVSHYAGFTLNCNIIKGCEQVTNSPYAVVFGIPVALLGTLYYLTILILSLLYADTKNQTILRIIFPLTVAGLFASGWFVYLQIYVIKAICQYCILSAITSTVLFICGLTTLKYRKVS